MKLKMTTMFAALTFGSAVLAQVPSEGRELAKLAFQQADTDSSGSVSAKEYLEQGENIFISMDSDESGDLTEEEFTSWDFGMDTIAEDQGMMQAYIGSRKTIFDYIDTNLDWKLTADEMAGFSVRDFLLCDADRDGLVSEEEMLLNSIINMTIRSAIMPSENRQ